jgi:lysophospholipase L1-like esterase
MTHMGMLLAAVQGFWVSRRQEELPPAGGEASGRTGNAPAAEPLRVAVLGESTAAGCGVTTHHEGFAGSLARRIFELTGRPVLWDVVGQHGATARRIRHRLLPQLGARYDLVVLLAGANDVLSRRTTAEWREDLTAILDALAVRADHTVVAGTPPFATFPSLPGALRRYLAEAARSLDEVAEEICSSRANATWVGSADVGGVGPDFFARDGFHPSAIGYRRWAELVADTLPNLDADADAVGR